MIYSFFMMNIRFPQVKIIYMNWFCFTHIYISQIFTEQIEDKLSLLPN